MSKIATTIKFTDKDAQAAFDRAQFLFDCAERASAAGLLDLMVSMSERAIAKFNEAKDRENVARRLHILALALRRA